MNVRMIDTLAIHTRIVQTQMEVTLVLALMVITGMETFVLVNAIYFVVKSLFSICTKNVCIVIRLSFIQM